MDNKSEISVTPSILRGMLCHGQVFGIGDDMIIASRHDVTEYDQLEYPFRIDSYLAAFCLQGRVRVSINLNEYELCGGMLLLATPGNIIRLSAGKNCGVQAEGIFTVINVSETFFRNIGIDLTRIILDATKVLQTPCISLNEREITLLGKYVDIVLEILNSGSQKYVNESISSVISSVFYQFAGFIHNNNVTHSTDRKQQSTRQKIMFEQFMRLVADNHRSERQMGFYADKLCVTPKYLSKVIKELSGKSGPQWIDEFVILSAKNMLRHSDISINEISSYLNFSNQSFFFRFFKSHTGLTPNRYRQM